MYMTKQRKHMSIYNNFKPRSVKHKEDEVSLYISNMVSGDVSKNMCSVVKNISSMIISSLSLEE